MSEFGQINLFDDVIRDDETFVIVVQEVSEIDGILKKTILREYPSLTMDMMKRLYEHLTDLYASESLSDHGKYFSITVYTNQDYAGENIYAHIKRYKHSHEWTTSSK